jgi:hypothetical protein
MSTERLIAGLNGDLPAEPGKIIRHHGVEGIPDRAR